MYIIHYILHIFSYTLCKKRQKHNFLNNLIKFANTKAVRNLLEEQTPV